MAKFAPVAPPELLADLKAKGILGDYHLLLAHDVYARPGLYNEVFDDAVDSYIIMDNSLVELGAAVPTQHIAEASRIVDANVVVLPDIMNQAFNSVEASMNGAIEYRNHGLNNFMAVIQGNNIGEVWYSIMALDSIPGVSCWGIPRVLTKALGSRTPAINLVKAFESNRILTGLNSLNFRPIHLLGFSDDFDDDCYSASLPKVSGIDSAVPIRLGLSGGFLNAAMANNMPPRGDYWEGAKEATPQVVENLKIIRGLIGS